LGGGAAAAREIFQRIDLRSGRTTLTLPDFIDDIAVQIEAIELGARTEIPGTG